jgi:hypothetical protein
MARPPSRVYKNQGPLVTQLNAGRRERLKIEMQYLRGSPERRLESLKRERVKVDSGSIASWAGRRTHSVHSRLVGETADRLARPPEPIRPASHVHRSV